MKIRLVPLRDVQQDKPMCECSRCSGEIYHYDPMGEVEGEYLHIDCMTPSEQEFYRMAPAYAFFLEECR